MIFGRFSLPLYMSLFLLGLSLLIWQTVEGDTTPQTLQAATGNTAILSTHPATGQLSFARFPLDSPLNARTGSPETVAQLFLTQYGAQFGVQSVDDLILDRQYKDTQGNTHIVYKQTHAGLPVFGGDLRVHFDVDNQLRAINGVVIPDIAVSFEGMISAENAQQIALKQNPFAMPSTPILTIYHTGLLRGEPAPARVAYQIDSAAQQLLIDAHTGQILNTIETHATAIQRNIYDSDYDVASRIWTEGDTQPYGDAAIDTLIDISAETYNLFSALSSGTYLGWDGNDAQPFDTVYLQNGNFPQCPNASWNTVYVEVCEGLAVDDIIAHEWGHAYTGATSQLIYQYQSGALNESFSDIWGETVDLLNDEENGSVREAASCLNAVPSVTVNSPVELAGNFVVRSADFNPLFSSVTGDLVLVNDGSSSPTEACSPPFVNADDINGKIALIDRGTCFFVDKVNAAAAAGALGVVIANNVPGVIPMFSDSDLGQIPALMVSLADGELLRTASDPVNLTLSAGTTTINGNERWLVGEASDGNFLRDMWTPTCLNDPGKVSDESDYVCLLENDEGGVHINSGIPNHLYSLLVDGGAYNGITVEGIGLTKAAHIHWQTQSNYLVAASNFANHADGLEQACGDLTGVALTDLKTGNVGAEVIDSADCLQLSNAIQATELRILPTFCNYSQLLEPNAPTLSCSFDSVLTSLEQQTFEAGFGEWTIETRAINSPSLFTIPNWTIQDSLPDGRTGQGAFVPNPIDLSACDSRADIGVLIVQSPAYSVTTTSLFYSFDHWMATEFDWDGGNLKISVNDGDYTLVPASAFIFNSYNDVLLSSEEFNDNPLAGEPAFTGSNEGLLSGSWGQSQIDLSTLGLQIGDTFQIRFEMGYDGCNGLVGWYIDDVTLSTCAVNDEILVYRLLLPIMPVND